MEFSKLLKDFPCVDHREDTTGSSPAGRNSKHWSGFERRGFGPGITSMEP
jgi:hypothetical protein